MRRIYVEVEAILTVVAEFRMQKERLAFVAKLVCVVSVSPTRRGDRLLKQWSGKAYYFVTTARPGRTYASMSNA